MRLVVVLVALVLAASSFTPASADAREDAARDFADGEAADARGDFKAGIAAYKRAFDRVPHHFAAYNIAVDHERLKQYREAAAWFTRYLDMAPRAKDRDSVDAQIVALKLKPAALTITSRPAGATVLIDNQQVGVTPYLKAIRGGGHRVSVVLGDQREERDIVLEFGEPRTVEFTLRGVAATPRKQPPTSATGGPGSTAEAAALDITGAPIGATVAIDHEVVGTLPVRVPVSAGRHKIEVTSFGYAPYEMTVDVEADAELPVPVQLVAATDAATTDARTLQASYLLGAAAGVDLRGEGSMWLVEFGIRAARVDFSARIGKQSGLTVFELLGRWTVWKSRFSPFIGLGYYGVASRDDNASGSGGAVLAGLRYDLSRNEQLGVSLLLESGARIYSGVTTTVPGETPMTDSGLIIPLMVNVQLMYGRGR